MLRTLDLRDIEDVLAIQAASPEIAQWSLWDYDRVARGEMAGWVALVAESKNGEITGFIVARPIASDLEILNFAVRPTARRQGIGAALLDEALRWGSAFSAGQAFLEVRASNLAALRFYEQHKFQVTGRRPRYYTAPIEDALVLSAQLS